MRWGGREVEREKEWGREGGGRNEALREGKTRARGRMEGKRIPAGWVGSSELWSARIGCAGDGRRLRAR